MRTLPQNDFCWLLHRYDRWFSANATRLCHERTNRTKKEKCHLGSTQLWACPAVLLPRVTAHDQFCNVTSLILRSAEISLSKREKEFNWPAIGRCNIKQSTTENQAAHSTPLRYSIASLESNELYEKRCHVNVANSWLKSRKTGRTRGHCINMRTRFTR